MNKISEAQQRRAEIMLDFGTSSEARTLFSIDLAKRFNFCADVRGIDTQRFDEITNQASILTGKFLQTTDRIEMAHTIEKLYALAQQVDALPIRD